MTPCLSSTSAPLPRWLTLSALIACCTAFALPTSRAELAPEDKAFETPTAVDTTYFVPANLMKGTLHSVAPLAQNDGLNTTYTLTTPDGTVQVVGTAALITRIREAYALDYLRKQSKEEAFGKAMLKAGKAPIDGAIGVIKNPIGTITGIPRGASKFFGGIGEGLKGGKSKVEGGPFQGVTGVSKAKMQLAVQLGVSPYTTNEELQRELTNMARAVAGGGLIVQAAMTPIGGPAGQVLSGLSINTTLQNQLINSSPEEMRIVNRKKLFALGLNRDQADAFLMHPWFSPWHKAIITDALAQIGVNPAAFLKMACLSQCIEDAFYFQQMAQLLQRYSDSHAPLRSIQLELNMVTALDVQGELVVPVPLDYAIWAQRTETRCNQFQALQQSRPEIKGLTLWTTGYISQRASKNLQERHILWKMKGLQ